MDTHSLVIVMKKQAETRRCFNGDILNLGYDYFLNLLGNSKYYIKINSGLTF